MSKNIKNSPLNFIGGLVQAAGAYDWGGKRKDAISIIKRDNFKTPKEDIKKFCSFVGMTEDKFFKICENFRNNKIWIKKKNKWVLKIPLK